MVLDLSLRRWSVLPRLIQTGNEEPRKAHYLGRDEVSPLERQQQTGGKNDPPPQKPGTDKYRALADLTLSEVEDAFAFFRPQLVEMQKTDWVAKNYFSHIPLKRNHDGRPAAVFGRIASCYPTSGELENVEDIEMQFPRWQEAPDLLHVQDQDINRRRATESFFLGVKTYVSAREQIDFQQAVDIFAEKGYATVYENGYGDLLDLTEERRPLLPWVYVFGSEWFATVPDSMQPDVKAQIHKLLRWNRAVLNYHPRRYLLQYRSLNDELEFNYGFTEHYLLAPQDTNQVLTKVDETFGELFMRGMN